MFTPGTYNVLYVFLSLTLLLYAAADSSERPETDNVCVIHLIGKPEDLKPFNDVGDFKLVSFNCTGSKLPVAIYVHPSVYKAAALQEGVTLVENNEIDGLIQFDSARSLTVLDSVFEDLRGTQLAPVVFDKSAGLFYNCRFSRNTNFKTGGIYVAGSSLMHVYDSVFDQNKGERHGGVFTTGGCKTLFRNTEFTNNQGGHFGSHSEEFVSGAVFAYQNTLVEFEDCRLTNNIAAGDGAGAYTGVKRTVVKFTGCTIEGNSGGTGALSLTDYCTGTLTQTKFIKNEGVEESACVYAQIQSDLTITDCQFIGNKGASGAIMSNDDKTLKIVNSQFVKNKGDTYGGAVSAFWGQEATIERCVFESNLGIFGGAVFQEGALKATFTDSQFISNEAKQSGGAIFQKDVQETTISNCDFVDNKAGGVGGALSQNGCGNVSWLPNDDNSVMKCLVRSGPSCESIDIKDSTFKGNSAGIKGSSISHDRCNHVIVLANVFPDEKFSIVQERCQKRKFEDATLSEASIELIHCPESLFNRRLLALRSFH